MWTEAPPKEVSVWEALHSVVDPELGDDLVDLGMIRSVDVATDGTVTVAVALTVAGCPLRSQIRSDVERRLKALPGVSSVVVKTVEMSSDERRLVMERARYKARERAVETDIVSTVRVLAVASGKGGVGKSSVTANLGVALARRGFTVGILDADIWGFSIPRMLGMSARLEAREGKMIPVVKEVSPGRLKVISMGFLAGEDRAIMWRGLVLNRAVQQFLQDVRWGEMDYLLIDMPPGTGDIQMGLARMLPRTEMLIVTTPPLAAQKVASRAADMARRGYLRVAAVIENMSAFTCEHGQSYQLFGSGGGARLAEEIGAPLAGSVPLDPALSSAGDSGIPITLSGTSAAAQAFFDIAAKLSAEISPPVEMAGCTARLLGLMEKAVDTSAVTQANLLT